MNPRKPVLRATRLRLFAFLWIFAALAIFHGASALAAEVGEPAPDFRMEAMRKYGIKNPRREMALRSWFIVDKKGVIRFKHVARKRGDILPTKTLLRELRESRGTRG